MTYTSRSKQRGGPAPTAQKPPTPAAPVNQRKQLAGTPGTCAKITAPK